MKKARPIILSIIGFTLWAYALWLDLHEHQQLDALTFYASAILAFVVPVEIGTRS